MGYTTDFYGSWKITPAVSEKDRKAYEALIEQQNRREQLPGAPGGYCQWELSETGEELAWDGGEKFYDYEEWVEYFIKTFFAPKKYSLSGVIHYRGEDLHDMGAIGIKDNVVRRVNVQEFTLDMIFPEVTSKRPSKTEILFEGEPKVLHPSDKKSSRVVNPRNAKPPRSPGVLGNMAKKSPKLTRKK